MTTRHIIGSLIALLMLCPTVAKASQPEVLAAADSAYSADNYQLAADLYRQAIDSLGTSADIYYNLGNTEYRLGHPGRAVVAYERALRLEPTHREAKANLEFVNSRIIDRVGQRGTLMGNMVDSASTSASSNTWAWLAVGSFTAFLLLVSLYIFGPSVGMRKTGFFGGFVVLIFAIVAGALALHGASISSARDKAVITVPSTILSTSPREPRNRTEEAILLHEGTRVTILDSVRSRTDSVQSVWYDVEIDNNHRAWVNSTDVEII